MTAVTCLLVGVTVLVIGFCLLLGEVYFIHKATAFNVSIVEVRRDLVHKGKGGVMAYVPVVEIPSEPSRPLRITVDTFSEEPVYRIGSQMDVLCDLSDSPKCIQDTFFSKWGGSVLDFIFALVFLSIPLHYWRSR